MRNNKRREERDELGIPSSLWAGKELIGFMSDGKEQNIHGVN